MKCTVVCAALALSVGAAVAQERPPILDMHLHALAATAQGPPPLGLCTPIQPFPAWDPKKPYGETFLAMLKAPACADPVWSPMTDDAVMSQTLDIMERRNVIAVLSGPPERMAAWRASGSKRFIPGLLFQIGNAAPPPDSLRGMHERGDLDVLGEVANQYAGIAPDDSRMEPYWALAEELDIPVGIHVGPGPPGAAYLGAAGYLARLHSALTMEPVLLRHPRLRVYLMHAGFPLLDDLLALLYAHPQVYVDVGVIVYTQPREVFYRYLRAIVEAGFDNRVMFGSDQMVWPAALERSIAVIEEAPFLSAAQKRALLYDNAARFLRLSEEEMARHRRM